MKFKNRLDDSETIHMRGLSPKNEPIRASLYSPNRFFLIFAAFSLAPSSAGSNTEQAEREVAAEAEKAEAEEATMEDAEAETATDEADRFVPTATEVSAVDDAEALITG